AHVIEKCLFLRHHQHHTVLRFHTSPELVDLLHDGALALAEDGTVIGADYTAARLLEANDRYELVGRPIGDIFGTDVLDSLSVDSLRGASLAPVRGLRRGQEYYVSVHGGRIALPGTTRTTVRSTPAVMQVAPSP